MGLDPISGAVNGKDVTTVANQWTRALSADHKRRDGSVRITNGSASDAAYQFPAGKTPYMANFQGNNDTFTANGLTSYLGDEKGSIASRIQLTSPLPATDQTIVQIKENDPRLARQFVQANLELLSISSNASLVTGDIPFTFTLHVYFDSTGFTKNHMVGKFRNVLNNMEYLIRVGDNLTHERLTFLVSHDGFTESIVSSELTGNIVANKWYFVACWHDPDKNEIGISVDGGPPETKAHSLGVFQGISEFTVGARKLVPITDSLDGRMALLRYWKGRVLTYAEILEMYNYGGGVQDADLTTAMQVNLESSWPLNEASGTAFDTVGSNDLTDNNTVTQNDGPPLQREMNILVKGTTGLVSCELVANNATQWKFTSDEGLPVGRFVNLELLNDGSAPVLLVDGAPVGLSLENSSDLDSWWETIRDFVDQVNMGYSVDITGTNEKFINGDIDFIAFYNKFPDKKLLGEFVFCDTPASSPMTITDTGPNKQNGTFTFTAPGGVVENGEGAILRAGRTVLLRGRTNISDELWVHSGSAITLNIKEFRGG